MTSKDNKVTEVTENSTNHISIAPTSNEDLDNYTDRDSDALKTLKSFLETVKESTKKHPKAKEA